MVKMSITYLLGLFWIVVAGITQGAFPLPMKYTRAWKWEHLWFWFSVIAFFLLPTVVAMATVPHLATVLSISPRSQMVTTALFGLGWGFGSVFFGLGLDALGMALAFPLMTGLYTALGALIPLLVLTPALAFQRSGLLIIAGNLITIVGVTICTIAGDMRDKKHGKQPVEGTLGPRRSFPVALAICVLAGVLSAMFNFGYAFGSKIIETAVAFGATKDNAPNALWMVMIPAGGIVNVAYCLYLLTTNRSWSLLVREAVPLNWIHPCVMGVLWTGSVILYGWGARLLGPLGPTVGWSLWNAVMIVTTVACGLATHEWKGINGRPFHLLLAGIAILVGGMCVLGMGL
jgi:L-rhamnose-H+ transport protein